MTTRRARPTLAELRRMVLDGEVFSRHQIIEAIDRMHDRLREEVVREVRHAVNEKGFFMQDRQLVVRHDYVETAIRRVFDGRRRRTVR